MASQRRFVADAAHELRSPMTAISLQAERLEEADMSEQASQRLRALREGIDRGRNLLNQLLALAKAQSSVSAVAT
ncbi:histidine kinase dimerization/phospho-acceptor domain-containing protein, partial [Klebsiella pneumoniae]